ncbi:hypothetical protein JAAARDRAFT_42181 [Jaapia argillacea MUCL 33604]|uniref:Uncharacterized protein n=1 Tax=Jaapia argillacea MUCL 33604 TaxID=933084 RepID=A0A067PH03_9AGAM|nr:hypothetical protein JAAARDRAFT_42181 [Jaapia argillacea MUCL 33604]
MAFLMESATNASLHNVSMVFYSGNDDDLAAHRGTEVNTTFGGIQGFTRKPSTPWYKDDGTLAGIVHRERNLTYALFIGARHLVPEWQPQAAYVFLREFILGHNTTGLVEGTTVFGGESSLLGQGIIPGTTAIFYGWGTTVSSTSAPSATIASWASFLATATTTSTPSP